ncbi:MAG: class I SAM-dependent methyltransferase [Acidobacteriota bacterium]
MASPSSTNSPALRDGQDFPNQTRAMFGRAGWILVVDAVVYWNSAAEYPGPAAALCVVVALIAVFFLGLGWWMVRSSKSGKQELYDSILELAAIEGSEKILDVGCGLGLLSIAEAKQLKTGKVIGVGTWDQAQVSRYTAENARENAKLAGVGDKLRFENGDLLKLGYPDGHFDLVTSFMTVHRLAEARDRAQAVREMYRVLKPGGKLLIHDPEASEYRQVLTKLGANTVSLSNQSYLWAVSSQTLSVKK